MQSHFIFFWNTHSRHPISHLWGWAMGCLLWFHGLTYALPLSLRCYIRVCYIGQPYSKPDCSSTPFPHVTFQTDNVNVSISLLFRSIKDVLVPVSLILIKFSGKYEWMYLKITPPTCDGICMTIKIWHTPQSTSVLTGAKFWWSWYVISNHSW